MYTWNIDFHMKNGTIATVKFKSKHNDLIDSINKIFVGQTSRTWNSFVSREDGKKLIFISLENVSYYEVFE